MKCAFHYDVAVISLYVVALPYLKNEKSYKSFANSASLHIFNGQTMVYSTSQ